MFVRCHAGHLTGDLKCCYGQTGGTVVPMLSRTVSGRHCRCVGGHCTVRCGRELMGQLRRLHCYIADCGRVWVHGVGVGRLERWYNIDDMITGAFRFGGYCGFGGRCCVAVRCHVCVDATTGGL